MVSERKFEYILNELKNTITVRSIMVSKNRLTCYPQKKYDIMPIINNGIITSYWNKETDKIHEILEKDLVSSNVDLFSFIKLLKKQDFYFVVNGNEIIGLAKGNDLNKSPVRFLMFFLVAELELRLKKIFDTKRKIDPFDFLSDNRKIKLRERSNKDPNVYEYFYICDYIELIKKQKDIKTILTIKLDDLGFIDEFRNSIAHPTKEILGDKTLEKFDGRINRLIKFNKELKQFE